MCIWETCGKVIFDVFIISIFVFCSIKLYTTFWSLSLYDLHVPISRYDEEIGKLEQSIKALDDNTDMVGSLHTAIDMQVIP